MGFSSLGFLDQTEHKRPSGSLGTDELEAKNLMSEEDIEYHTDSAEVFRESSRPSSSAAVLSDGGSSTSGAVKKQFSKSNRNRKDKLNEDIIAAISERSAERHEILKKISSNQQDSVDLFFQSIAASVKSLKPDLINEAKLRTMHLVCELENRNASESRPYSAPCSASSSQHQPYLATPPGSSSGNMLSSPSPDDVLDLDDFQLHTSTF